MIKNLSSPSVCVIDDEEEEYTRILDALMTLGIGCVHIRGRGGDKLPPKPFEELRLVFIDLHLSSQVGKTAASHTAHVFKEVVSVSCGPVLVVIWSKYATDPAGDPALPPEEQPTEADLFKAELLSSEPKFRTRLVFTEMPKPKIPDRPAIDEWIKTLQNGIKSILKQFSTFDIFLTWEALVRKAGIEVSEMLTNLTETISEGAYPIEDKLKQILKLIVQTQGGPDCSVATAPRHLMTVFSQIGLDILETTASNTDLQAHAEWLAEKLSEETRRTLHIPKLNTLLLTSSADQTFATFIPGTIYDVVNTEVMKTTTGFDLDNLYSDCFNGKTDGNPSFIEFKSRSKPVFLEITPACDFHQNQRRCVMLLAGLLFPVELRNKINSKDAFKITPVIEDRHSSPPSDICFVFCSRYHFTAPLNLQHSWLQPHLRLRDILTIDIRNWHANQSARVGYLSF